MNVKQTIGLMAKAGWTPALFAESLNSTARIEAQLKKKADVPQISIETAEQFLATGKGISGPVYDVLEKWAERRTGFSNGSGPVFDPPSEKQHLAMVTPPVILPVETELSQDGPEIVFHDVTNERARQKMLGR